MERFFLSCQKQTLNAMIKILAMILTVVGIAGLIIGIFGSTLVSLNPWAAIILGAVFFFAGILMLQTRRDTDKIR